MGWADCGTDSAGRRIGYAFAARCDHPKCKAKIDRGLSYACGDMHGETEFGCEKYFCEKHRRNFVEPGDGDRSVAICDACAAALKASSEWEENEDGEIVPIVSSDGDE